jgi:hypothetical protein
VASEDVVHVLGNMVEGVKPGGLVFDLQVIRPDPVVEVEGRIVCEIDGEPLFRTADSAAAAIDAFVAQGRLVEQARDDHDVREHFENGAELVEAFRGKRRRLPEDAVPELGAVSERCVIRERCRLRRLQVVARW